MSYRDANGKKQRPEDVLKAMALIRHGVAETDDEVLSKMARDFLADNNKKQPTAPVMNRSRNQLASAYAGSFLRSKVD